MSAGLDILSQIDDRLLRMERNIDILIAEVRGLRRREVERECVRCRVQLGDENLPDTLPPPGEQ